MCLLLDLQSKTVLGLKNIHYLKADTYHVLECTFKMIFTHDAQKVPPLHP